MNYIVLMKSAKIQAKPCGSSLIIEVTNVSGFVRIVKGMKMILTVVLRCFVIHAIF